MRRLLLAALLAPGAAGADIIDLEYWGTVLYVTGDTATPGDPINGRFQIDTALAPKGDFQGPSWGQYQNRGDSPLFIDRSNFISDPDSPFCGCSLDRLLLVDSAGNDSLWLLNYEIRADGSWFRQELEFDGSDFLDGARLDQDFAFDQEATTFGRLIVHKFIDGVGSFVQSAIHRVRGFVRGAPGACRSG